MPNTAAERPSTSQIALDLNHYTSAGTPEELQEYVSNILEPNNLTMADVTVGLKNPASALYKSMQEIGVQDPGSLIEPLTEKYTASFSQSTPITGRALFNLQMQLDQQPDEFGKNAVLGRFSEAFNINIADLNNKLSNPNSPYSIALEDSGLSTGGQVALLESVEAARNAATMKLAAAAVPSGMNLECVDCGPPEGIQQGGGVAQQSGMERGT